MRLDLANGLFVFRDMNGESLQEVDFESFEEELGRFPVMQMKDGERFERPTLFGECPVDQIPGSFLGRDSPAARVLDLWCIKQPCRDTEKLSIDVKANGSLRSLSLVAKVLKQKGNRQVF